MNGKIPEGWRECKLGDIAIFNYGKALKEEVRINGNIPVFSSSGLSGWHNKPLVNSKGIIIGRKGTIGKIYKSDKPFYCIDTAYYVIPNDDKYDFNYLFYSLKTLGLEELNSDSAVPGLNRDAAYNQDILLPPLPEQRAIASVLSSLDDKIDLLHRQNKTLEAMAETLFRQWFVEPCKDGLPEGWEEGKLGQVLSLIESGMRPKGGIDPNLQEGIPSIGAENINGIGKYDYSKTKFITKEFFNMMKRGIIHDYDVLIYKDGAYVGRKGMFGHNFPYTTCAVNEHVFILRSNDRINQFFLYFLLQEKDLSQLNVNSAQPGINQESIKSFEIVIPPKYLINEFGRIVEKWIVKIFFNAKQICTLEKLRDTLLPKLMSGEVRVQI